MRRKNHRRRIRHFIKLFDEDRTAFAQIIHDETVMHDFVTHIDRRTEHFQSALDDFNRTINTGTEATWVSKNDVHD